MSIATANAGRRLPRFLAAFLVCNLLAACTGGSTGSSNSPTSDSVSVVGSNTDNTATDTTVNLRWLPNQDSIAGYILYYGPDATNTVKTAVQLSVTGAAFDAQSPSVALNAGNDLGLRHGESVCFRLRAYNSANALSDWSAAACGVI